MFQEEYDVIVVGAGHAGSEAAAAAANMGSKVLLITMNLEVIAKMSCNPAMGGIGKGQLLREIDALGGYSAIVSDRSMIQFRMLNKSKGAAMWSPRTQNDRMLFSKVWRELLEETKNLDFYQDMVTGLMVSRGTIVGVKTGMGNEIKAKSVILTNGTFLNGIIHVGEKQLGGGRMGEKKATGITEDLVQLGFESSRLKTGTPPRVDSRSLDFSQFSVQEGDKDITGFSYLPIQKIRAEEQRNCWITYTSPEVHEVLKTGFSKSPMFQGRIKGVGPRYCPSIEDKINRFADKDRHQIFIEPEGWKTVEMYINGFSSSLPQEIQYEAIKLIPGFEKCKFFRPGYAIEYDYFPPAQLKYTLETKLIDNLYLAGQINGTTGYEEAASQGLMAGINAHLKINHKEPFILKRNEAYIGVLIDDLINKGIDEPYRMFTSRAEFRTSMRQDNADFRLTERSYEIGLARKERLEQTLRKKEEVQKLKRFLEEHSIEPSEIDPYLEEIGKSSLKERQKQAKLLLRPEISIKTMASYSQPLKDKIEGLKEESINEAEIQIKYDVYFQKEKEMVKKMNEMENLVIPQNFNYKKLTALRTEARQKLERVKPQTLGQASRISGVNPSDIQILMVYMGR